MRYFWMGLVTAILIIGFDRGVEATGVGLAPAKEGVGVSVDYSHIFDQKLENPADTAGASVDQSQAVLAKIHYAFDQKYSVYAKLGTADLEGSLTGISGADRATYKLDYDFGFAWGLGGKAIFELGATDYRAIFDLQYLRWESGFGSLTVNGASPSSLSASDATVDDFSLSTILAREWHLGDAVLTPYLGVKFSLVSVDYGTVSHDGVTVGGTTFLGFSQMDLDSEDNVGIIVGTRYDITGDLFLNLEGRFIDETAMTVALEYEF